MIQTKRTRLLSANTIKHFGPYAKAEWLKMRQHRGWFYSYMDRLWTIYVDKVPVCVIGLRRTSFFGTGGEVVFFLCREFCHYVKRLTRFIRRAMLRIIKLWGALTVKVAEDFWIGQRFVRYFGFRPVGHKGKMMGETFELFEMRASWLR